MFGRIKKNTYLLELCYIDIVNTVYKLYNYITKMDALWSVYRALRPIYGVHNRPTERTIRHTIGKLENNLTLLDDTRPIRPRTTRTVENIAAVNESFAEDPEESIRRWSQQLDLSYGTTYLSLVSDRWIGLQDRVISHLWTFICGDM